MRCDIIAEGVVAAVKEVGLKVPLVVRLEGTNVEEGKALLKSSGLAITPADDIVSPAGRPSEDREYGRAPPATRTVKPVIGVSV